MRQPRLTALLLMTSQENSSSDIITELTPGAQYRVLVYHTNGPLSSPPSEPVIIHIGQPISSSRHLEPIDFG